MKCLCSNPGFALAIGAGIGAAVGSATNHMGECVAYGVAAGLMLLALTPICRR